MEELGNTTLYSFNYLCGFVRVQRILIFVVRIAIQYIKGAAHRNIICKEIKRIVAKSLHVEKLNIIILNLHIMN